MVARGPYFQGVEGKQIVTQPLNTFDLEVSE